MEMAEALDPLASSAFGPVAASGLVADQDHGEVKSSAQSRACIAQVHGATRDNFIAVIA
jgi:hypothetical protein